MFSVITIIINKITVIIISIIIIITRRLPPAGPEREQSCPGAHRDGQGLYSVLGFRV